MTQTLLTSEAYVKAALNISDNVSTKYLIPAITEAQEVRLRSVLGDCLLDACKGKIEDETINLPENAAYKFLVDRCQAILAYMTAVQVIPKVTFKIGNFGLVKSSDENQQVATVTEMDKMIAHYTDLADTCCRDLQRYILNHRADYPELRACDCNAMRANLYSAATCGIWLGGARGKMRNPNCCGGLHR